MGSNSFRQRRITYPSQGCRVSASRLQPVHPGILLENRESSSTPCLESGLTVQESHTSSPSSVDWKEQALSSELHCGDSKGLVEFSRDCFQLNPQVRTFMCTDAHRSDRHLNAMLQQMFYSGHLNVADLWSSKLIDARLDAGKAVENSRNRLTF